MAASVYEEFDQVAEVSITARVELKLLHDPEIDRYHLVTFDWNRAQVTGDIPGAYASHDAIGVRYVSRPHTREDMEALLREEARPVLLAALRDYTPAQA